MSIGELIALQADYAQWLEALPDATRDRATAETPQAIIDLDLGQDNCRCTNSRSRTSQAVPPRCRCLGPQEADHQMLGVVEPGQGHQPAKMSMAEFIRRAGPPL